MSYETKRVIAVKKFLLFYLLNQTETSVNLSRLGHDSVYTGERMRESRFLGLNYIYRCFIFKYDDKIEI